MKIKSVTVLTGRSTTDIVWLKTDLPPGLWPYKENTTVKFEVAQGEGEGFVKTNFPDLPLEIIDLNK